MVRISASGNDEENFCKGCTEENFYKGFLNRNH